MVRGREEAYAFLRIYLDLESLGPCRDLKNNIKILLHVKK